MKSKKYLTLVCLVFLFCLKNGYAQNNNKFLIIKSNALSLITLAPNLAIEAKTYKKMSIILGASATNKILGSGSLLFADYRFYIGSKDKPSLTGFYAGPGYILSDMPSETNNFFGPGGIIGYQWISTKNIKKSNFCLDFNLGLYVNNNQNLELFIPFLPKASVSIGIALGK